MWLRIDCRGFKVVVMTAYLLYGFGFVMVLSFAFG